LSATVLGADRNVAVVAPTVAEAAGLCAELAPIFPGRVISISSSLPAKESTRLWVTANKKGGVLIVGTPEIATWPLGGPALWIVVEEGRRAMKAKQTPTLQVHEIVRRRALVERTTMVYLGAVPTLDAMARGIAFKEPRGRLWPLVELVDRNEDPSSSRSLASRTVQAIRGSVERGGQVFVFVSRLGYAPAFRCVRCRQLRACASCGAGANRGEVCKRCGSNLGPCVVCGGSRFEPLGAGIGRVMEELQKQLGREAVGEVGSNRQVLVGSEKDLPFVPETALSVAVDGDSLLMAPHYRAEEDSFRLLARVVLTVSRGGGRRGLIQTGQPSHRAMAALQSARPLGYLQSLLEERERDLLPPASELLAIEVTGDPTNPSVELARLADSDVQVHGPQEGGGRSRWFLQGLSLRGSRVRLRSMVQKWRDSGLKVRIDADPIDL
jgi:primosomal protein N' (replication factor Y)